MDDENYADAFNGNNTPFAKLLGVTMTLATKSRLEGEIIVRPDLCTIPGTIHGGALMAFADNMGATGAYLNLPEGAVTSTIESKTNMFRPIPKGQKAFAVTTPINIGRTLQVWQTHITREDGKLAAIVTQTQIIQLNRA